MRILFLHQIFSGQFLRVAIALRQQSGHELLALVPVGHEGLRIIPLRAYPSDPLHARTPDLLVGHGGWGETLFARRLAAVPNPALRRVFLLCRAVRRRYRSGAVDSLRMELRTRNASMTLALFDADHGIAPTGAPSSNGSMREVSACQLGRRFSTDATWQGRRHIDGYRCSETHPTRLRDRVAHL